MDDSWLPASIAKLMDRTNDDGCWRWTGFVDPTWGYGQVRYRGARHAAHRLVYSLRFGPNDIIGKVLHHRCPTKRCVRPDHLQPMTAAEHVRHHFRQPTREWTGKSPSQCCKRGHEWTKENTYVDKYNRRFCRACQMIRQAAYLERKKIEREEWVSGVRQ